LKHAGPKKTCGGTREFNTLEKDPKTGEGG